MKKGFVSSACMFGPYDNEADTILCMEQFAREQGYQIDISATRHHHEIYLNDVRRCKPENLKTVIRHPIRKLTEDSQKREIYFRYLFKINEQARRQVKRRRPFSPVTPKREFE